MQFASFHTSDLKNCLKLRNANVQYMDEWTIKTPSPICQLSLILPIKRLCGILFNRFYRLEIHSLMVGIFDPAEIYLCTVAPLQYLLSDLLPLPPPSQRKCTVYTDSVWQGWGGEGGGGVELYCRPYSAGALHSVSDQIQNLQNCFTTPNKNDQ